MRVLWIDRWIFAFFLAVLFTDAHFYGAQHAMGSCAMDECMEATCYWRDLNGGFDKWKYDNTTAWTGRNKNPLGGSRTQHATLVVAKQIMCTNTAICANPIALDLYEAQNCTNCVNDANYYRYFCANVSGIGVTGSWNEGKDANGKSP